MSIAGYHCTNPDCEHITVVKVWPATRTDPADSTWGDGCDECGEELERDPVMDEQDYADEAAERAYEDRYC